ncbi:MAG: choice-of-anchor Q domain-containing protein [Aggregatilineales bacterium]
MSHRSQIARIVIIALLTGLFLIPQKAIFAATITVTTNNPIVAVDGVCSLIEAIDNANDDAATHADCPAGAGADTITLTGDNVLNAVAVNVNGPTGLPSITSPITLEGAGFRISRNPVAPPFRIFHIAAGGDLTLNNTILSGGLMDAGFDNGGGIFNAGTLTLNQSAVQNNIVESIFPSGGGIYNTGNATLINSTVSGNVADDPASALDFGGGIYSTGDLLLINSVIFGNSAAENGGGIYATGNTTLNNSIIANNTSGDNGGGLLSFGGAGGVFRINNSTFSGNSSGEGGAIYNGNDDVEIFGSTFTGNTATNLSGGAITNFTGTMQISASLFEGNRATGTAIGGAISNLQLAEINLFGSIVRNNSSETFGGGLITGLAAFNVFDSLITGNTALNGGGIYELPSNAGGFLIMRSTVSNNFADGLGGGALFTSPLTTPDIINSTFTGNRANLLGGAIALNAGGVVNLVHSTIAENFSTQFVNSVGGTNFFAGTATLTGNIIANNVFEDCSATNASTSFGFNVTTGPSGGIPADRWCAFIPLDPTDLTATDPLLGTAGNLGSIGTAYPLLAGSPAIDLTPTDCPAELLGVDQRGVPRPVGSCDSGSISDDNIILPLVYFATPSTLVDNEGTAGTQFVNVVIDNTAGNLTAPTTVPLTVYITQGGTAANTSDFNAGQAIPTVYTFDAATFPAPGTIATIPLSFAILDDLLPEGNETINLGLSLTGPAVLNPAQATHILTIIDDDSPPPPVTVADNGNANQPGINIFDPAISKIGFLRAGELGITGERLEWVITVSNPSSVAGTSILITDVVRPELRVDNVTTTRGAATVSGQTVSVNVGTLNPGDSLQIVITTTVLDGVSIVDNTACVTADNQATLECVTALPVSALPATGETPLWRSVVMLLLGAGLVAGLTRLVISKI